MNAVAPASDRTFVEVVLGVQSLVSRCAPPAMIYQAVVDGALRLLSCDGGSLRFVDLEDPTWSVAVAGMAPRARESAGAIAHRSPRGSVGG